MASNTNSEEKPAESSELRHQILVIDARRCTGCEVCESVCSFVHDEEFNPLNSRINRVRLEPIINATLSCLSCFDPECIKSCPLKAITKDPKTGIIRVDEEVCDGCGACVRLCPYGCIVVNTHKKKAITCDLCESSFIGENDDPRMQCIQYCPKDAIFVREIDPTIDENRLTTVANLIKAGFPNPEEGDIFN